MKHVYSLTILILLSMHGFIHGQDEFADVLLDAQYIQLDRLPPSFFGSGPTTGCRYFERTPEVCLGNTSEFISVPAGSFIVVGFIDNTIINAPNTDDIFIDEIGAATELGIISVSADFGQTFTRLGEINGGTTNRIDLDDYNYNGCVNAIKIEGLDREGCVPGFDVVRVYGLPGANISNNVITTTICEGEDYLGISEPGIYLDTFSSVFGCDSIVTLNLLKGATYDYVEEVSICLGDTYDGYTQGGLYVDVFQTVDFGCDSTRLLDLTIEPAPSSMVDRTICEGEQYENYTEAGNYVDFYELANDCDSVRYLTLSVLSAGRSVDAVELCDGETYLGFTQSGQYEAVIAGGSSNGCDSFHIVDLQIIRTGPYQVDETICDREQVAGYNAAGTYTDTLVNRLGCDSIRVLTLAVFNSERTDIDTLLCAGRDFASYVEPGIYVDTLTTSKGCDSVRSITLTTTNAIYTSIDATICQGQAFAGYTEPGLYTETIPLSETCDSIVTISLDVSALTMPNIFSPNGDSFNELFKIGATNPSLEIERMAIYDRWGNMVYEADNFLARDENLWWDGRYNGAKVPLGVYAYFVQLSCSDGQTVPYRGTVTVMR